MTTTFINSNILALQKGFSSTETGTRSFLTAKFPGLLLRRVASYDEAAALGGVLITDGTKTVVYVGRAFYEAKKTNAWGKLATPTAMNWTHTGRAFNTGGQYKGSALVFQTGYALNDFLDPGQPWFAIGVVTKAKDGVLYDAPGNIAARTLRNLGVMPRRTNSSSPTYNADGVLAMAGTLEAYTWAVVLHAKGGYLSFSTMVPLAALVDRAGDAWIEDVEEDLLEDYMDVTREVLAEFTEAGYKHEERLAIHLQPNGTWGNLPKFEGFASTDPGFVMYSAKPGNTRQSDTSLAENGVAQMYRVANDRTFFSDSAGTVMPFVDAEICCPGSPGNRWDYGAAYAETYLYRPSTGLQTFDALSCALLSVKYDANLPVVPASGTIAPLLMVSKPQVAARTAVFDLYHQKLWSSKQFAQFNFKQADETFSADPAVLTPQILANVGVLALKKAQIALMLDSVPHNVRLLTDFVEEVDARMEARLS